MQRPVPDEIVVQKSSFVPRDQSKHVRTLAISLLIATVWLTTRPYSGILGDSRFYTVQALNALMPGRFSDDLYFRYGSQDQFTLFSLIYKPFLVIFGLADGHLLFTILSLCLFLICLFSLSKSMFRDTNMAFAGLLAAIMLPGNLNLLYVGESTLTPRLFAEAFTLYALGLMLRGRPIRSFLILSVSITVHPLMTLPGLAILFIYEAIKRPALWLAATFAVVAAVVLALCNIQPFSRLFVCFDPAWLAVVQVRDHFCLIAQWRFVTWLPIMTTFALAALGLIFATPFERRFLSIVFAVAVGGIAVCFIGGDLFDNVLIVDVQTWRAVWPLVVVAHLFIAPVCLRMRRRGKSSFTNPVILLALAFGLLALSNFVSALCVVAAPMAIIACCTAAWEHRHQKDILTPARVFVLICCGVTVAITIMFSYLAVVGLTAAPVRLLHTILGIVLTIVSLGALGLCLTPSARIDAFGEYPRSFLCLSIALVVLAGLNWDQRSAWTTFVDTTATPPAALTALLPGESPIYWEGDVTVPWFLLKRSSYFSCDQGTGVLFSRGTAINYATRYKNFEPLRTLDFGGTPWCPSDDNPIPGQRHRADLTAVCQKDPGLGYLVFVKPADDDPGQLWVAPVKFEYQGKSHGKSTVFKTDRFYVYDCAALRKPP
jgi:hypothetical protein